MGEDDDGGGDARRLSWIFLLLLPVSAVTYCICYCLLLCFSMIHLGYEVHREDFLFSLNSCYKNACQFSDVQQRTSEIATK